ncbi:unnamed protein product [Phytophthora lilii]|uniref:Unnamed protein product n=1 Tax=Phytophthora lilii TaxID=2077276 RepID=A0A9W6WJT1_9STRA|nr:unnamed protein product [Phytophthora lilii]
MECIFPALNSELLALDQRLLNNKLAGMNVSTHLENDTHIEAPSRVLHKVLVALKNLFTVVHDERYYTDAESTDRETAKILCPSIANGIQVELLKSTLAQIIIFQGCNDQLIVFSMTSLLEMTAVPAQTILFSVGDCGNAMYIVHSGVLAVVAESVVVRDIRKGSCFGELFVYFSIRCTATVITTTYSILYKLSRFHCERVLEGYPDCGTVISSRVESMLNKRKMESQGDASFTAPDTSSETSRKFKRRPSFATEGVAAVSTFVKVLSKRGSRVVSWQASKPSVSPALQFLPGLGPQPDVSVTSRDIRVAPSHAEGSTTLRTPTAYDRHAEQSTEAYKHHGLWQLILLRSVLINILLRACGGFCFRYPICTIVGS